MVTPTEQQAKAAWEQWSDEPDELGQLSTYPAWEELSSFHRELWFRIAAAVLNGAPLIDLT